MNERIRKLACDAAMVEVVCSQKSVKVHYPKNFEKFAELIVGECIEQLRLVPYGSDSIEFGEEVPYQDAIKQHFGVE